MVTALLGTASVSATSRSTASFARPPSGGAVTRTFQPSPYGPTIPARPAPGLTRSRSRVHPCGMRQVYAGLRGFDLGFRLREPRLLGLLPRVLDVVHDPECRPQPLAQEPCLDDQPLVLAGCAPLHVPRLRVRLGEDQLGLAARLLLHVGGCPLRGDERRAQKRLELLVADEIGLELLDLVGEVRALAPHVLEAHCDLREQPVGGAAVVTEEPRAGCQVSDFDWCDGHSLLPLSSGTLRGAREPVRRARAETSRRPSARG